MSDGKLPVVSDTQAGAADPVSLDEVTRAVLDLSARAEAASVAAGFLELVQRWAAPSAVLAAARDPAAASGWRLLPALCAGSLTLGIEKTLARLAEESKDALARPTVLRGEEVPGVRVRDNVVVPWWHEGESGLLVLRGVPRPMREGLGEALALAAAPVWPRLLGGPVARIEALVLELQGVSMRLEREASRQLERLQAVATAPEPVDSGRQVALETELAALRQEHEKLGRELETSRRERETAGIELAAARQQAENARRELETAREEKTNAGRELEAARRELEKAPARSEARQGDALQVAVAAARRAAFVPPLLRVSMQEVGALAAPGSAPAGRLGVALLDRDVVALEPVAAELEAAGIEVRLANQPEELALLLRTQEASTIDAVVCDVMSFRPDQNVAGIIRAWDKDRPGLSFYLSYDGQSPAELERAKRTPMSLTAGHIQRPLVSARLVETLDNLAKRLGKT
jgi:hypothetical protein